MGRTQRVPTKAGRNRAGGARSSHLIIRISRPERHAIPLPLTKIAQSDSNAISTSHYDQCPNTLQLAAKVVPTRRIVFASVASTAVTAGTASITTNSIEKPMKKQCISALIPRDYKLSAKCVPGIAAVSPILWWRKLDVKP